jgi:hypothetical protein
MRVGPTILILLAAGTVGRAVAWPKDLWKTRWKHIADWSWVIGALGILATIFCLLLYGSGQADKTVHESCASILIVTLASFWLYKYAEKRDY